MPVLYIWVLGRLLLRWLLEAREQHSADLRNCLLID